MHTPMYMPICTPLSAWPRKWYLQVCMHMPNRMSMCADMRMCAHMPILQFHHCKPSDLLPELQGRLPIRVELKGPCRVDLTGRLATKK